jgi:hypothetical protein
VSTGSGGGSEGDERVRVVHLLPRIDEERDVLDSDVVVVMLAPIRWSQPEVLLAEAEVDDLFGPAVARVPLVLTETERSK